MLVYYSVSRVVSLSVIPSGMTPMMFVLIRGHSMFFPKFLTVQEILQSIRSLIFFSKNVQFFSKRTRTALHDPNRNNIYMSLHSIFEFESYSSLNHCICSQFPQFKFILDKNLLFLFILLQFFRSKAQLRITHFTLGKGKVKKKHAVFGWNRHSIIQYKD